MVNGLDIALEARRQSILTRGPGWSTYGGRKPCHRGDPSRQVAAIVGAMAAERVEANASARSRH